CRISYNMNKNKMKARITDKPKAIISLHLNGKMSNMNEIIKIAKKYNFEVIEDAAQAIGAEYKCYKPGELGSAATFSFFPTKNLGAYGDGGMIVTNNSN